MGPENLTPRHVHQSAGGWVDLSPSHGVQLPGEEFFDFQAASQLPEYPSWLFNSQVVLGQDNGTEQQPTFGQQLSLQTLTNDEFAHQWQDMDASAFVQQSTDQTHPSQTLLNEDPFAQQISDLNGPGETFFNQEQFGQQIPVQQMPIQQPSVEYAASQETFGPMWAQQPVPDQAPMEYVPLQPMFMEEQGQMLVPQSLAPRVALGLAPCHFLTPVEAPPSTVPPGFTLCGRCNQPFEVARNRGDACLFHRVSRPTVDPRHRYWVDWNDAMMPRDNPWSRANVPDAFIWPCCSNPGSFLGCSSDAHKTNDEFVTEAVQQLVPGKSFFEAVIGCRMAIGLEHGAKVRFNVSSFFDVLMFYF
ncbi:hypothetical protein E8E11_011979 [Didymella keratinophila]|nr:hypothetical protein E8E11_011979 [Didymella keratinophila]